MTTTEERFVELLSIPRLTEARLKNLLERFGSPEAVFEASLHELMEVEGIEEPLARAIQGYRPDANSQRRIELARKLGVKVITYKDPGYPEMLRRLPQMPPVLFVRGEIDRSDELALAIIGTRRATSYGRVVAERFAQELAEQGITIVSGLARGIDTYAHRGALKGKGRTIAVLGCGIDRYYPPENRKLQEEIARHGAVISEFPLSTPPLAQNFPKRNRLISGLALGVLVVEARDSSGVFNTVGWALDQGREVYAVPGHILSQASFGTNRLIKEGAKPVTEVADILSDLKLTSPARGPTPTLAPEDARIADLLTERPLHVDELSEALGVPIAQLLPQLLELELKGVVRQLPGKLYTLDELRP